MKWQNVDSHPLTANPNMRETQNALSPTIIRLRVIIGNVNLPKPWQTSQILIKPGICRHCENASNRYPMIRGPGKPQKQFYNFLTKTVP